MSNPLTPGATPGVPPGVPRPKVLVVDDQAANLVVASRILQALPVEIVTASSGPAALALVLRHEFAVVLLDVRMPDMDGYETASLIRDHTAATPVPIVFLTAEDREEEKMARGYDSGAVDFLYKPVNPPLLLSKVRVFVELYQHRRLLQDTTSALRQSNLRLNRLLNAVGEGIIGIESDGRISLVNPTACLMLQTRGPEIQGRNAAGLLGLPALGSPGSPFDRAVRRHLP